MAETVQFWFRRRHNLTPLDPRYLEMTVGEMAAEYWAHRYFDNPNLVEFEDEDFDLTTVLASMERDDWEEVNK